jgi:hypothetical protein
MGIHVLLKNLRYLKADVYDITACNNFLMMS